METENKHIWTKAELVIVVIVSVVVITGYVLMMQAASDFGDEHFPMSRFTK